MSAVAPEIRADRSSLRRVTDALGDRIVSGSGDQFYARCPAHDDHQPSLSVTWKSTDRGGRTLIRCHGLGGEGCDVRDVAAALSLAVSDLFDTPPARPDGAPRRVQPARSRKAARDPERKNPPAAPSSAGERAGRGRLRAKHCYTDADGVPVFDVLRFEGGAQKFGCQSYTRDGRRVAAKSAPAAERRVLYALPRVRAAIEAGEPVWLVEGESDADALLAAGVAATTNPFGAIRSAGDVGRKWLPQYTEALRGAKVIMVADRDQAGACHVVNVAGEIGGVVAELTTVRAAIGKDARDHLEAGRGLGEFVPVELSELRRQAGESAPAAEPESENGPGQVLAFPSTRPGGDDHAGRGGGGGGRGGGPGDGDDDQPVRITVREEFDARPDGLFKIKREGGRVIATELLPVPVRLAGRVIEDLADGAEPELSHVDLIAESAGEEFRLDGVNRKRWESCSWVSELPWPAGFKDTAAGRSTLRNAIMQVSGPVPLTTMYGALGWQEIGGRWVYVHAGGALSTDGPVSGVRVRVVPPLESFALPEAPASTAELAAAVQASVSLLDAVPAKIAAPLLGAAYRAVLGQCRVTVMLVGGRASGKTGLAAVTTQHYAPTARHNRMPGAGAGEDAATSVGLEELRYRAGHMLLPLDDLAPDRGPERASIRAATIARSQFNGTGKLRGMRDGGLRVQHPPRSLPLLTGEEGTTVESADSRIVSIRVARGDVDVDHVLPMLDSGEEPMLRAKLTTAMVRHYADRMPLTDWLTTTVAGLRAKLRDESTADPGLDTRHSESVAELAAGWRAMIDMAISRRALTEDQAAELWARAWGGLVECKRALMAGSSERSAAGRVRELLTTLLVRRQVALEGRYGGTPDEPTRYGWEDLSNAHTGPAVRMIGEPIGWTDGRKVWLSPGATYVHLDRQATAEHDALTWTRNGLGAALADANVIPVRWEKEIRRTTVKRRVGAAQKPLDVWEFDHGWLFPDEEEPAAETGPTPPTVPAGPAPQGPPAPVVERPESAPEAPAAASGVNGQAEAVQAVSETHSAAGSSYLSDWLRELFPEASAEDLAAAEGLWRAAFRGIEFRGPYETAMRVLNGSLKHQSIPELPTMRQDALAPVAENRWAKRTWMVEGEELKLGTWLRSYDVNGMYLSAAQVELGTGDPELFDAARMPERWAKLPGWVQLAGPVSKRAPYGLAGRMPAGMWVPTPIAGYLAERKALPKLAGALLWTESRRWLGPHVKLFRDARTQLGKLDGLPARMALAAVKATYTRAFGGALRSAKYNRTPTLRPDWAQMIEATGQARMFRNLDKTDARLVGVHVDAAWLIVPTRDAEPAGLPISSDLGKFHPNGQTPVTAALIEAHRTGTYRAVYAALEESKRKGDR